MAGDADLRIQKIALPSVVAPVSQEEYSAAALSLVRQNPDRVLISAVMSRDILCLFAARVDWRPKPKIRDKI